MRCPVHVTHEMQPVAGVLSERKKQAGRGLALDEVEMMANPNLVNLRCVIPGCIRVALLVKRVEIERICPGCKLPTDAPAYRSIIGDHRCKACVRRRRRRWKLSRERAQRRARV